MVSGDRQAAPPHLVDASIARQMSDMIKAFRISQIVGTIAQLGIPDRLASGARTTGELASLIGCHAEATHRLMRYFISARQRAATPKPADGIAFNHHFRGDGAVIYKHACAIGCEGIVSKRLGTPYRSGRVDHWLKVKNPVAPAVKREAEEDWGSKRWARGRRSG